MNVNPPKLVGKLSADDASSLRERIDDMHNLWRSTFIKEITVFQCTCGRTYADKKSAIICLNNDIEESVMSQPPGKTRAMPNKAKKKPTTTAAKKRKKPTKKA